MYISDNVDPQNGPPQLSENEVTKVLKYFYLSFKVLSAILRS